VTDTPGTWAQLVSCGGTKYCCSNAAVGVDCCNKQILIFDIGIPTVINDFGEGTTTVNTTASYALITASAKPTGASSGASSATALVAGASDSASATPQSSSSSIRIGMGAIIGIALGVVAFFVVAAAAGIAVCCMYRKRSKAAQNAQNTPNLIDMNSPYPQPPGTSASFSPAPSYGGKFAGSPNAPPSPWGEPAPPYPNGNKEFYSSNQDLLPKGANGEMLIELQSPVPSPAGPSGQHLYELPSPAPLNPAPPPPPGFNGQRLHELA